MVEVLTSSGCVVVSWSVSRRMRQRARTLALADRSDPAQVGDEGSPPPRIWIGQHERIVGCIGRASAQPTRRTRGVGSPQGQTAGQRARVPMYCDERRVDLSRARGSGCGSTGEGSDMDVSSAVPVGNRMREIRAWRDVPLRTQRRRALAYHPATSR